MVEVTNPQQTPVAPESEPQKQNSPKLAVVLSLLFIVILIAGIVVFYKASKRSRTQTAYNTTSVNTKSSNQLPSPQPTGIANSFSSNAQLDQDTQTIDTKLNALDTDLNNVNQGLSDQQGDLQ